MAAPLGLGSPREAAAALAALLTAGRHAPATSPTTAVRDVVWSSWLRSAVAGVSPDGTGGVPTWPRAEAADRLAAHPMAGPATTFAPLLVEDLAADGLLLVVTDGAGQVLWVDGHRGTRTRAERVALTEGADWGERAAGTNAMALALATGACAQVHRYEHFVRAVHPFSSSAAPVRDPVSGTLLGCVAVVGGDHAATPAVLALVRTAVAAAEAGLRWTPLGRRRPSPGGQHAQGAPRLQVLGRDRGLLTIRGRRLELSRRHSELLLGLVLADTRGQGRSADQLAVECWEAAVPNVTVRSELTRLRRIVGEEVLGSRPYRLHRPIRTDVAEVVPLLQRGWHRQALDAYPGQVLPGSTAPVVVGLRETVHRQLRSALVAHGSVDLLERFAATHASDDDAELWAAVMRRVPLGSARYTVARAQAQAVDSRLR